MQRIDENMYFKERDRNTRIEPLRLRTTNSIFEHFPKVKNIWFPIKNYSRVKKKIPFEKFDDLILGELEETI
uniref:Uncharacterized protein n=1 Tax=Noccaea caerulescens TaxID=107243 RepID=A0A1J3J188_NOCCA